MCKSDLPQWQERFYSWSMSPTPDMTTILEDLSAGRIGAAEAARRIDALKSAPVDPTPQPIHQPTAEPEQLHEETVKEPSNEELASSSTPAAPAAENAADAWAASTDRPQQATYTTESFARVEPAAPSPEPPIDPEPARTKPVNTGGVDRISIRAVGRRVRIVGETSVATLSADGPHVLRRNGSVLEVSSDGEMGSSLDGFSILRAPRNLDDVRSLAIGKELFLKVNPNIIVDVEVTAGSLNTERVPHLGKVRVTAGGAKLIDVEEINDALIQAGTATIKGSIKTGRSRIRAESGSLTIKLADDSNVTITGDAQLGRVSWSGQHSGAGDEVVMGNGSARLEVEVVMGHAQVRVGSEPKAEAGAR
jgi:hypothetical protein